MRKDGSAFNRHYGIDGWKAEEQTQSNFNYLLAAAGLGTAKNGIGVCSEFSNCLKTMDELRYLLDSVGWRIQVP